MTTISLACCIDAARQLAIEPRVFSFSTARAGPAGLIFLPGLSRGPAFARTAFTESWLRVPGRHGPAIRLSRTPRSPLDTTSLGQLINQVLIRPR
jgi:hypothetical protein